jgi:hypothetical protein
LASTINPESFIDWTRSDITKFKRPSGYRFICNLYFDPPSGKGAELRKYGLAKSSFDQITYLTNGKIAPENVYVTNLCNAALDHSPKGKTVFITEDKARKGLDNIRSILASNPSIEFVFPMSLQVNYWL